MTNRRSAAQLWAALLIVYLVWGSTYLAIRVVVQGGVPPLLGMGIRFLLAAPLLADLDNPSTTVQLSRYLVPTENSGMKTSENLQLCLVRG